MPVPTNISQLSTTPALNSPAGSESPSGLDDYQRTHAAYIAQLRDSQVSLTGAQTIAGVKTFTNGIVSNVTGNVTGNLTGNATTATSATSASTATTATNLSRSVLVAGLATGGGVMDADRTITVPIASQAEAAAGTDNATAMTPLRVRNAFNATGSAPVYACRAWVNFNGININGSYSRTGTLVTVTTSLPHGMETGMLVTLDFLSGDATDGSYPVTVINANTFTVTDTVSGTTSGSVSRPIFVRSGGNVSSVVRNGTGDYTVNFTTAMPDANYCAVVSSGASSSVPVGIPADAVSARTASSIRVLSATSGFNVADSAFMNVSIFR